MSMSSRWESNPLPSSCTWERMIGIGIPQQQQTVMITYEGVLFLSWQHGLCQL